MLYEVITRSTPFIVWCVLMLMLGGPRFVYRFLKDRHFSLKTDGTRVPVLLIGAADAADLFIRAMESNPAANYRVVGILGETGGRVGRRIRGISVMGTVDDIETAVAELTDEGARPHRVILTKDTFRNNFV